ncbi:MAG TPA: polysaccharide deacetylase family protein [Sphingobacteriaceae bacterium]|nr:polysaccharide deacetylase family protein [Sphingobacteriaceae bacterium]
MVIRLDRSVRRRFTVAVVFLTWLILVRGAAELYGLTLPAAGGPQPVRSAGTRRPAVALTFNITWGDQVPPAILKSLAEHGVPATFFVAGPWAEAHPEVLQALVEAGHEVGTSGARNLDLTQFNPEDLEGELQAAVAALADAAGVRTLYFRPPGGSYDDRVLQTAAELGLVTVLWDVDSRDWLQPGPEQIAAQVLRSVQPGSIILLHAGDTNTQTVRALPSIIKGLRERDLAMVTLTELLRPPAEEDR